MSALSPRHRSAPRLKLAALASAIASALLLLAAPASAYIGPGAGFALLSSFLVLLTTVVIALLSLLIWPFRTAWRVLTRKRPPKAHIQRLIVVGFDGQDPKLTDRFMKEGKLPNFEKLAQTGCYKRIETTYPALSPVAWSSFSTGTNPGKHNIFDFLDRDLRSYLPKISSTHIGRLERKLRIGKLQIPLKKPELRLLRKSKPFWSLLGERNIWSTVLRVPITFPPDRFYGAQLAAMCVPDLLGTQGTFLLFTTRTSSEKFKEGGERIHLEGSEDSFDTVIEGPENSFSSTGESLRLPMRLEIDRGRNRVLATVGKQRVVLEPGKLTDWIDLSFPAIPTIKVHGLTRMMVTEMDEHFSLYLSPINISPERPAMPVSHPSYYAPYLAKKIGSFSTLGLAEDTWALNEKVTDDQTFLQQTYDIDHEREEMMFSALDRLRKGALVCVFDGTDRIQHMFWRYIEEGHPALDTAQNGAAQNGASQDGGRQNGSSRPNAIAELYEHNDELLGRVMEKLQEGDLLMVLSDHGFASFRRGVNLNAWLQENGYLTLRADADGSEEWLQGVDWSKTQAYALGLSGMFLNLKGREAGGIVAPGEEAQSVKAEIRAKLQGLRDQERNEVGINEAFDTEEIYDGPYTTNAPDLVIGFNDGYRTSWDCATGVVSGPVFEDNTKAWSGDHCIDPRLVPGVFFCNREIDVEEPSLLDIAPTALQLFGLEAPAHMEGRPLFDAESLAGAG